MGEVIALRLMGATGSGKSRVVSDVLACARATVPQYEMRRRKPVGYVVAQRLLIIGHYDAAIKRGMDNMNVLGVEYCYEMAEKAMRAGLDVLMEGDEYHHAVRHTIGLHKRTQRVHVLMLSTDFDTCVKATQERGSSIDMGFQAALYRRCEKDYAKLQQAGVPCEKVDRVQARIRVRELLGA